jgi:non-specific serine/threonine protein kinase
MRGLHYLATLLREPGREFQASDLIGIGNPAFSTGHAEGDPSLTVARGLGDAGAPIDARARAAYRERLRALDAERAEAERNADLGQLGLLSAERAALLSELEGAARGRRSASHSEHARIAVTKAIKAALEKIAGRHPELGAHLSATIRRGNACAYLPDPRIRIDWET